MKMQMGENQSLRNVNNKIVRAKNKKMLLMLIQEFEPVSIELLIEKSKLSYPTIYTILKDLVNDGFIEKRGYAPTTGGRQASLYSISGISRYTIGIHLYYNTISATLCTIKGGRVYDSGIRELPANFHETEISEIIQQFIFRARTDTRIPANHIMGICLCTPNGTVKIPTSIKNEPNFHIRNLAKIIQEDIGILTIGATDREVLNCYEKTNYRISQVKEYLFILFEKELGLTIQSERFAKYSQTDTYSALGHITVIPDGAQCICGKKGCLESYENGQGLYEIYCNYHERGQQIPSIHELMENQDLFHSMLELCHQKDPAALAAMDQALQYFGISIANIIKTVGISTVVISGLFTSNDMDYKMKLEYYIRENVPEGGLFPPVLVIGTAQPQDSAYAACLMLNKMYMETVDFSPGSLHQNS
jgi:predicted NBD/HSP70 family sugar kinase